jgi:catechol 2,3-dioxygenase-like lactoylglutathione lyase family enzyme
MLIDHIEIPVSNADAARKFYEAALRPLRVTCVLSVSADHSASGTMRHGLGSDGYPRLWLHDGEAAPGGVHLAFTAPDRATVDAFHAAAMAAGGRDNGLPGIRTRYHPSYYAAFVFDLDGNNVELVCQTD